MTEYENEFDDPALRAAVQRTAGREAAPASLRARVASLLAADGAAAAAAGPSNGAMRAASDAATTTTNAATATARAARTRPLSIGGRDFWRTAAVAAAVLLVLGWLGFRVRDEFFPPRAIAYGGGSHTAIPASLVLEVVRAHDACAKLPDHHKLPGDDLEKLREKLTAGASVNASVISLGADWKFRGAGVCTVGDKQAAHLQWVREDEYLSIFSMTATEGCGYGADSYRDIVEKHPVAGFRHGDALYCVVASAESRTLGKEAIDAVLQQVQGSLAIGCMTHEAMMETAAAAVPAKAAAAVPVRAKVAAPRAR